MKKIIIIAAAVFALACPMFALNLEAGAKFNLGYDILDGESTQESLKNLDANSSFQFGGALFANLSLLGGFGVQVEPTIFKSTVKFTGESFTEEQAYDALTLDVPVMPWFNLNLFNIASVGLGAGINFSTDINKDADYMAQFQEKANNFDLTSYAWSFICGADAKFYINKHVGIVASVRYLMDFTKREVPIVVEAYGASVDTGATYPEYGFKRRFIYGGIGVELKLF